KGRPERLFGHLLSARTGCRGGSWANRACPSCSTTLPGPRRSACGLGGLLQHGEEEVLGEVPARVAAEDVLESRVELLGDGGLGEIQVPEPEADPVEVVLIVVPAQPVHPGRADVLVAMLAVPLLDHAFGEEQVRPREVDVAIAM